MFSMANSFLSRTLHAETKPGPTIEPRSTWRCRALVAAGKSILYFSFVQIC